jgi:nucleotide-binding universal stress UspA family protein
LVCVVSEALLGAVGVAAGESERRRAARGLRDAAKRWLDAHASKLRDVGVNVTTWSPAGDPATEIVRAAERTDADLILIGRHGAGRLADALLGSTARRVLRETARPVLLVPEAGAS